MKYGQRFLRIVPMYVDDMRGRQRKGSLMVELEGENRYRAHTGNA